MACQRAGDPARDVIIEQNQHSVARGFVEAARREFEHGIDFIPAHRITVR
jgi:hypothetical protein